jgi:Uma2 family endonuclease
MPPPLIVEVLSPSNTPDKVNRQRIVALSAGTREFWAVDAERRSLQVTDLIGAKVYAPGEATPLRWFGNAVLAVDRIFKV